MSIELLFLSKVERQDGARRGLVLSSQLRPIARGQLAPTEGSQRVDDDEDIDGLLKDGSRNRRDIPSRCKPIATSE
jgi:hypothetical protein